jgi:hypothetical protein
VEEESLDLDKLSPEMITSSDNTKQIVDLSVDPTHDRSNCSMSYVPSIVAPL